MPSESKMMARIEEYKTKLAKKSKEVGEHRKGSVPGLVVAAGPAVSATSAYAHGVLDSKLGTADNKHPASIVGTVLGFLAAGAAVAMGHPTAAALLADAASGPLDGLAYMKGAEMGAKPPAPPG